MFCNHDNTQRVYPVMTMVWAESAQILLLSEVQHVEINILFKTKQNQENMK